MLRRLSLKFTAAAVAALFLVELVMAVLINGLNVYYSLSQADEAIAEIAQNNGKIPDRTYKPDKRPDEKKKSMENRNYITRYFTAVVDESGNVTVLDTGHFPSITSDTAQEYAQAVYNTGESKGFYDGYNLRYGVDKDSTGKSMIVFYDFSANYRSSKRSVQISAVTAVILLVIMSVLILLFSRRAVKPIILNQEKQQRFITDAGHEIKTPLAIIRADTEVIEMTNGESEWTRSILGQTDRLNDLISGMLTLARSQEIQRKSFERVSLTELVKKAAEDFSPYCLSKKKPLESQIDDGVYCMGDRKMLEMMISVLLQNAVKYGMDEKTIELRLEGGKTARLTVSNLCNEIPKGDLNLLFDRFYRGDSSRTRETGGSGIGLSVAKQTADTHKAKITCTAEGSIITFTFKINTVA